MVLLRSINALNLASSSVSSTYKSGKGKIENPLLHGESGDAPTQTRSIFAAWDITYAYTFSGPLFLSSLPESYFHGPHRLGVCRNSILPEINTKPTAKASPTFFLPLQFDCRHNSDAPKNRLRLQADADHNTLLAGEYNSPYLNATYNKLGRTRSLTFSTTPKLSEQ